MKLAPGLSLMSFSQERLQSCIRIRLGQKRQADRGNQRPNVVGDAKLSNPTIQRWFNTSVFQQPAPFTFGNAPRYMSTVRAPGLQQFDIGIQKWFYWREILRLQFRAEMFSAFNRANFYAPDANFNDTAFGRISATLPPRDVQFGLKLYW